MGIFGKNPFKKVKREEITQAILELEKKKDEYQDDIFIKEKYIKEKISQGKKAKTISEKKVLSSRVLALQNQVKAIQKKLSFMEKKIYLIEQVKLAIDDRDFNKYNQTTAIGKLLKDSNKLQSFLTEVVSDKELADRELLDQVDMVDNIMGSYQADDEIYGESEELDNIMALMTEDIDDESLEEESVSESKEKEGPSNV